MQTQPAPPSVLIVDDDTELAAMLACLCEAEGWTAGSAATAAQAALAMRWPN